MHHPARAGIRAVEQVGGGIVGEVSRWPLSVIPFSYQGMINSGVDRKAPVLAGLWLSSKDVHIEY